MAFAPSLALRISSFSPRASHSSRRARPRALAQTPRAVVEHLSGATDAVHALTSLHGLDVRLLADAAVAAAGDVAATAGDVADAAKSGGAWNTFVGGVEFSLVKMHDALVAAGVPGAYGLTIILFTVGIKAITFPLNYKQMESTMKMQALSPRLKKIQADYKDNPQVLNEMTAKLYKDEQINPLAGCLPVVLQIPVWIALYRTVLNLAKEDLLDERFLFLPSLQGPVSETGQKLSTWLYPLVDGAPPIGWHDALCYLVLPVLLVASQAYSQKLLQPPNQDPSAAQANNVLKFMPLLIGWFSLNVPSGLGVYWVTNNLVSTLQTLFIRSRFNAENPAVEAGPDVGAGSPPIELKATTLDKAEGFTGRAPKPESSAPSGGAKKTSKKRRKRR